MYIFNKDGKPIKFGRVEIERNHDDFTQSLPNWLELVNCNLTENTDTNAVLTRISSGSKMGIQTKLYNFYNLDGIQAYLGNLTCNGMDRIAILSENGTTKIEFKKESTGQIGLYVNDTFIKFVNKKIGWANRTDITDGKDNKYYNKAYNIGVHFLPQYNSVTLLAYDDVACEYIIPTFNINQKFRILFEWNLASITFSQFKLNLWKSY